MTATWYLRKADATVYGPVTLDELAVWASDGRVDPDDSVSSDQREWTPAKDVPQLEMDCLIHFPGGEVYGPIHKLLLAELIVDGDIAAELRVQDLSSGQEAVAARVAIRALVQKPSAEATLRAQLEQMRKDHALVIQDATAMQSRLEQRIAELEKDAESLPPAVPATPPVDADLRLELDAKSEAMKEMQVQLTSLTQKISDLETSHTKELAKIQGQNKKRVHTLQGQIADLTVQLDKSRAGSSQQGTDAAPVDMESVVQERLEKAAAEWAKERADLERRLQRAQSQLAEAELSPASVEQSAAIDRQQGGAGDTNAVVRSALSRVSAATLQGANQSIVEQKTLRSTLANQRRIGPPRQKKRKQFPSPRPKNGVR